MNKFIWLILFLVVALVNSSGSGYSGGRYLVAGLGLSLPWFVLGLVLSPIWWGLTKKSRENSWKWFDWLNVGSYIMVVLSILSFIVKINM